jgi:hypothetical protein
MQTQLATLQQQVAAGSPNTELMLMAAKLENEIADLEFESRQDVPYKLTSEEAALHYNLGKSYSARQDKLVTVRGQVFALIYGQCTQLLQDKLKQEKNWAAVSASYKPLELYKLIESVVLWCSSRLRISILWLQFGTNIAKSLMQSKATTITPNGMSDSLPRWKWLSLSGVYLRMTRLLTTVLSSSTRSHMQRWVPRIKLQ